MKFSDDERKAYYKGRVSNKNLTEGQREYALRRLNDLVSGTNTSAPVKSGKSALKVNVLLTKTKNGKPFASAFIAKD
jgi:hypothetical protein